MERADAAQKETAEKYIAQLDAAKSFPKKIVTQVVSLTAFYAAEGYHQDYYTNNSNAGYCRVVVAPKVSALTTETPTPCRPPETL